MKVTGFCSVLAPHQPCSARQIWFLSSIPWRHPHVCRGGTGCVEASGHTAGVLMNVHMCRRPEGEGQLCHDPWTLLKGEDDAENYF